MADKRRTTKLMTKEHFESVRSKYGDVAPQVESMIEGADDEDKFQLKLVEGSPFNVVGADQIESKEDLLEAMKSS